MTDEDGEYCTICGGMVPKAGDVRMIEVDGKEVGIPGLDQILKSVAEMDLSGPAEVKDSLLSAVKAGCSVRQKSPVRMQMPCMPNICGLHDRGEPDG